MIAYLKATRNLVAEEGGDEIISRLYDCFEVTLDDLEVEFPGPWLKSTE